LFVLALAAVFACKIESSDQPVAIEMILPDSARVEVTDTFRPRGRVLNGVGDSVSAELFWTSFDTTLQVLDSATGVSLGAFLGTARLQARTGNLFTNPQTVTVVPRPDSIRALSAVRDTVLPGDTLSDSLSVQVFGLGGAIPANRRVVFTVAAIFPSNGPDVTLVPRDTLATNSTGVAVVRVRRPSGAVPDSVFVTATMQHFNHTAVDGSPVTFVVEFRP